MATRVVVLPQGVAAVHAEAGDAVLKLSREVAKDAARIAPVDTGNLASHIVALRTGVGSARVTAEADYAAYVELGTRNMSAQPFLRPSLFQARVI